MGKALAYKILESHLKSGEMIAGKEISIGIDYTLTQDSTGTMAYLQFEAMGVPRVKTKRSVAYIDHNTLQSGFENADDHKYIQTVAKKHGIYFSRPGNGICHQVNLERFGVPGATLLGSDSHTPTGGGIGMIAIGAGGLDVAVAMGGGAYYLSLIHIYHYRKAVQEGNVTAHEHACYTVISALRAGAANVPFMPVKGLHDSDLIEANDYFKVIEDPFSGERITVVKAMRPDVAVIHVHEADCDGNAIIHPPKFDDVIMSRAAKSVILTTERIVSKSQIRMRHEQVDIPGFLVSAVVETPNGAEPNSCAPDYDINWRCIETVSYTHLIFRRFSNIPTTYTF